jgi:hypothetical protein
MQEVSGACSTDLNGVARLSSIGMAMNQGLHLFSAKPPLLKFKRSSVGQKRRTGIRPSVARVRSWPVVSGLAQSSARRASRRIAVFENMMIDCSCICHPRFQNEVIGG